LLKDVVRSLKASCNADAVVVVSRDGVTIEAETPPGVYVETFSIMCATILGAAISATSELRKESPRYVILDSEDTKVIVAGAGPRALLVVEVRPSASIDIVLSQIAGAVSEIEDMV